MALAEIIEQLESCGYECEAGPLELNAAFVEVKGMVSRWKAIEALYDAVDDYIYSPDDNAYPDDYCNPEFLADLRIAFLDVVDTLEAEKQARAALAGARGEGANSHEAHL